VPGMRKKDKEFYDLHETLSDLYSLAEDYLKILEMGIKKGEEVGSGELQAQDLKQKVEMSEKLLDLIDDTIWPELLRIAGTSDAISHRRAGEFF